MRMSLQWSRGQAWALYGYTMMYRETGKPEYLEQARKVARFIKNHPNLPQTKYRIGISMHRIFQIHLVMHQRQQSWLLH